MLLPTRIVHPYERVPYVTNALVVANVATFIFSLTFTDRLFLSLTLNPGAFRPHQLFTHAFLHIGLLHLVGNMLFLAVYGRYVEDRLGPWRYLAAYFAFAVAGALAYLAADQPRPAAGASGAISGLTGFVLVAAPWIEVEMRLMYLVKVSEPFRISVVWLMIPWLLLQILEATGTLITRSAVSAHLGGFAAGAGLAAVLRHPRLRGTSWYLEPPEGGEAAKRRLARARSVGHPAASERGPAAPVAVVLQRVDEAPSRVAITKALMVACGMEPEDGMEVVASVAAGAPQRVEFPDLATAEALAGRLRDLGAVVDVVAPPTTAIAVPPPTPPVPLPVPPPADDAPLELPPAQDPRA